MMLVESHQVPFWFSCIPSASVKHGQTKARSKPISDVCSIGIFPNHIRHHFWVDFGTDGSTFTLACDVPNGTAFLCHRFDGHCATKWRPLSLGRDDFFRLLDSFYRLSSIQDFRAGGVVGVIPGCRVRAIRSARKLSLVCASG